MKTIAVSLLYDLLLRLQKIINLYLNHELKLGSMLPASLPIISNVVTELMTVSQT